MKNQQQDWRNLSTAERDAKERAITFKVFKESRTYCPKVEQGKIEVVNSRNKLSLFLINLLK